MSKVWFITGTSKGFGRIWAEAALERGDRVAATARDPATLDDLVERHGDAVLALELDVTDKDAGRRDRRPGARALRPPRRRRQQRRLRPVRRHRGGQRGAGPRADRDERLRRPVGDQGGAAVAARAGLRPHHPGLVDRRRPGVPRHRDVPLVQVGAGGLQPVAGRRGRRIRHPRDAGRADRLPARTGRARPRSRPTACRPTTRCAPPRQAGRSQWTPGRPAGHRPRHPRARRRRAAPAALLLRRDPAEHHRARVRRAPGAWHQWQWLAESPTERLPLDTNTDTRITTPFGFATTAAEVIDGIDLTGRRAIVTGGASGIGVETARALAGAGAAVTLAVRNTGRGDAVAAGHPRHHRQRRGRRAAAGAGRPRSRSPRSPPPGTSRCTCWSTTPA